MIEQQGTPHALYSEPATLFAADFMGSNNRLEGKLVENSGGRATIEVLGERLTGISRTKAAAGEKGDRHYSHRARALRVSAGPNR